MDINAVVSDPGANAYLTLDAADQAMDGYPNALKWSNLDEGARTRFLFQATRLVDRFKKWPPKQVVAPAEQALAFPTNKDKAGIIPAQVFNAVLETLNYFADGKLLSLKRLQAEGVKSSSLLGQNASFDKDTSELPAGARNELHNLWKSYSGPVLIKQRTRQMFQTPTSGSLYNRDQDPLADDGDLGPL